MRRSALLSAVACTGSSREQQNRTYIGLPTKPCTSQIDTCGSAKDSLWADLGWGCAAGRLAFDKPSAAEEKCAREDPRHWILGTSESSACLRFCSLCPVGNRNLSTAMATWGVFCLLCQPGSLWLLCRYKYVILLAGELGREETGHGGDWLSLKPPRQTREESRE